MRRQRSIKVGLPKEKLRYFYLKKKYSAKRISEIFKCSENKVHYWLSAHNISKRTISEAIYVQRNPHGDPFIFKRPMTRKDFALYGLGLGLYWGEGNKRNKNSIRMGNTDPYIIDIFLKFLKRFYNIERHNPKVKFSLQIFSDMSPKEALNFWCKKVRVHQTQFGKIVVTPARSIGTYKEKTQHGVLSVNFHNKKLRNLIYHTIETLYIL